MLVTAPLFWTHAVVFFLMPIVLISFTSVAISEKRPTRVVTWIEVVWKAVAVFRGPFNSLELYIAIVDIAVLAHCIAVYGFNLIVAWKPFIIEGPRVFNHAPPLNRPLTNLALTHLYSSGYNN